MSVEGIWQGLKVFNSVDIGTSCFRNDTMKNLKRTVRTNGPSKGHRKGIRGTELLGYLEARKLIYLPSYKWVLDHKAGHLVDRLRSISDAGTLVLLDYETNPDVLDPASPLSHAALIKAYIEGTYPMSDGAPEDNTPKDAPVPADTFDPGQRVRHPKNGEGDIVLADAAAERVVVSVDTEGQKTLSLRLAKLEAVNN